jgi:hypothetical protein
MNANTPNQGTVKRYMYANYQDHVDPQTGELNLTALVEDCDLHFAGLDLSEVGGAWDWAVEVNDVLERSGKVAPIC